MDRRGVKRRGVKAMMVTAPAMALALVIAGCGSGDDGGGAAAAPDTGGGSTEMTVVDGTTINAHGTADVSGKGEVDVEMDDEYFAPSILKGTPGETVMVKLENEGSLEHNFTIDEQKVDTDVEPGKTATVKVTFPQSGQLAFKCEYHVRKGMAGALESSTGTGGTSSPATTDAQPSSGY